MGKVQENVCVVTGGGMRIGQATTKQGERMDEFLRGAALIWYYGRWVALALFAVGLFWWGKGLL